VKTWIPVTCAVTLLSGCSGKKDAGVDAPDAVDGDKLEERDDLWYFEEKPFTGVAVKKWPNGQKWGEFTYKDGKEHDLWTRWYENGQKKGEYTLKDGKQHGLETWWWDNGQKRGEAHDPGFRLVYSLVRKDSGQR
jgi:antitoxin component YwqK of YwqJK toxin-antitoxin module